MTSPMTSGRVPHGTSSAVPPLDRMRFATHSAAATMSAACPASALTDGMAMNSASWSRSTSDDGGVTSAQSSQASKTERGSGVVALRYVAHALRIRQGAQLLQALVLDLANSLPRDVERTTHFV